MCVHDVCVSKRIYCLLFSGGQYNSNYISYLKADVVSSEVGSKDGN